MMDVVQPVNLIVDCTNHQCKPLTIQSTTVETLQSNAPRMSIPTRRRSGQKRVVLQQLSAFRLVAQLSCWKVDNGAQKLPIQQSETQQSETQQSSRVRPNNPAE